MAKEADPMFINPKQMGGRLGVPMGELLNENVQNLKSNRYLEWRRRIAFGSKIAALGLTLSGIVPEAQTGFQNFGSLGSALIDVAKTTNTGTIGNVASALTQPEVFRSLAGAGLWTLTRGREMDENRMEAVVLGSDDAASRPSSKWATLRSALSLDLFTAAHHKAAASGTDFLRKWGKSPQTIRTATEFAEEALNKPHMKILRAMKRYGPWLELGLSAAGLAYLGGTPALSPDVVSNLKLLATGAAIHGGIGVAVGGDAYALFLDRYAKTIRRQIALSADSFVPPDKPKQRKSAYNTQGFRSYFAFSGGG